MDSAEEFSNQPYYEGLKKLRNLLTNFSPEEILDACLGHLWHPLREGESGVLRHPWLALLLIKWAYSEERSFKGKPVRPTDFNKLLSQAFGLSSLARMPTAFDDLHLFVRAIACQQFGFQRRVNGHELSRQCVYFADPQSFLGRSFVTLMGLGIERFYEIALMIFSQIVTSPPAQAVFDITWFRRGFGTYPQEEIVAVLKAFSVSITDLPSLFGKGRQRHPSEYFEQSPLFQHPLLAQTLRDGRTQYIAVHQKLFERAMETFGYDFLKRSDPQKFSNCFGKVFEAYLDSVIRDAGYDFITEADLRQLAGPEPKAADFVIFEPGFDIIVEAKSVETSARARSTDSAVILSQATEKVAEAVHQANSTGRILRMYRPERTSNERFVIIVTAKDLHVGNGATFFDLTMREELDGLRKEYGEDFLAPKNFFIIPIDDFERLVCSSSEERPSIGSFLKAVVEREGGKEVRQNKFEFSMHLDEAKLFTRAPRLAGVSDGLFARIEAALQLSAR